MSIRNVDKPTVSELLNPEQKIVYAIPKYQREYTWRKPQWENLFDDLTENSEGYFLGTIICINASESVLGIQKMEVVDGQQRLTTLSLLLAALYAELSGYREVMDDFQKSDLLQLQLKLLLRGTKSGLRVIPQTQKSNLEDYKSILAENGIISKHPIPANAGNRMIYKAFRYFRKRIAAEIESASKESSEAAIEALSGILSKVCSATVVLIEVFTHADAYTLFESLNNRGTPLTAVDLIKNLLLSQLDDKSTEDTESLDYYYEQWQQVLKAIGDEYAVQERFLRHNYNAFRRSINASFRQKTGQSYPLGALATRSNLLTIYERIIKQEPNQFLSTLIENASIYSKIILQDIDDLGVELKESYQDLSRVQGVPSYILLLYLEKERSALAISDDHLVGIIKLLVSFFVRRNLTDTPPTRDLTSIFMGLIDEIEDNSLSGSEIYNAVRERLLSCSASDMSFEEKLRGPIYDDNYGVTRFILCALAERGMTVESKVDLWQMAANHQPVWTVEHILPQGDNLPQCWIDMIADGVSVKAKEYQAKYVHTLGNLTITGYNSTLSNRAFDEKRNHKDREGRYIGYRNGLNLNADVVVAEDWKTKNIKARTSRLVRDILELFSL